LTRTEADAEDLLQDTLLHSYTGFRTFESGTNLQAWLFRILHNRWVSNHRYKQRRPAEVPVDGFTEREVARSAETEALEAFPDNVIQAALDALPEGFRLAVYYADVEGFTCADRRDHERAAWDRDVAGGPRPQAVARRPGRRGLGCRRATARSGPR
jgi:DNA-directed RNA polymerase specialized sigma24 family protein